MRWIVLRAVGLLGGCAAPRHAVDEGCRLNAQLLVEIQTFGPGENLLRPTIVRFATLQGAACDAQQELPFAAAISADSVTDDCLARVRALGADERLTLGGTAPGLPLRRRDVGQPFDITLTSGNAVRLTPLRVYRGSAAATPARYRSTRRKARTITS